jgi:hypothetical protein
MRSLHTVPDTAELTDARREHAAAVERLVATVAAHVAFTVHQAVRSACMIEVATGVDDDGMRVMWLVDVWTFEGHRLASYAPDAFNAIAAQIDPDLDWIYRLALSPSDWPPAEILNLTRPAEWYRCTEPAVVWPVGPARS